MKIVISIRSGTIFAALLLYLVWMPQIITALDPAKPLSQYKRVHWDEEKGLPSSLITTMTQTRDGYLWFGTQEGLVRFNGFEFKVFEPNNTPTLKGKIITQVFEDSLRLKRAAARRSNLKEFRRLKSVLRKIFSVACDWTRLSGGAPFAILATRILFLIRLLYFRTASIGVLQQVSIRVWMFLNSKVFQDS